LFCKEKGEHKLRKLMMLGAMLAMVLVAAAPAIAQVSQGFEEEDVESGDVEPAVEISNKGDQVNLCAAILQSANTGNVQNEQGVSQYQIPEVDDIEFEGSTIEITPEAVNECTQVIEQAAAAGAKGEAKAGTGTAEAKVGSPAEASAGGGGAGGSGGAAGGGGAKTLPKTGGIADIAPLLGIGAGGLLVAGGLIARRVMR
jgi:hypothetical protein